MGGYIKSLIGAKVASIGLQAASLALNAAISMGLSLAISALVSTITKWVNKEKEAREEAIENAKAAKEESNNLSELLNKYNQLSREVKSNQGVKEDLLDVQSDLLEALGIEASQIDTLIEKYGDLDTAINQVTLDSLREAQGDLMIAVDAYEGDLIDVGKGYAHWYSMSNRNILSGGQDSLKAFNILEKAGVISSGSYGTGGGSLVLTGNDKTVEGILENYQKLKDAQEALNTAIDSGEVTMEEMTANPLYQAINKRLDELDESISNYNTAVDDLNKNIAQQQILKSLSEQSSIPETQEEFEAFKQSMIDTAVASTKFVGLQDDIRDSIINVLSTMPEFEKFFDETKVKSETFNDETDISTNFKSINDSLKTLTDNASLLSTINKEISETGQISADNLAKINEAFPEDKYPEMTEALYKYQLGLINEKELFAELEKCYLQDKDKYIANLKKKAETDESFWSTLYKNSTNIQSALIKVYGADYKAFSTATEAKKKLLDNLSDKYTAFMKLVVKGSNGLYVMYEQEELKAEVEGLDEGGSVYANSLYAKTESLYNSDKINEFKAELDKYNNAVKAIDDEINKYFQDPLNWQDLSDFDTSSSSSDTAKSYDLIERAVENLRRKMTSLKNTTDDTFASWSDRNQALINQIQTTTEQIQLQQKAYDKYMQLANSTGLSDYYKGLIQNGAIDEIPVSDKVTQEQIDSYKDYYDKAVAASEAVDELKSSLNELEKSKMDIISNEIDKIKNQITIAINLIDGYIELAETSGLFASEDLYKQLIEYYQKYLSNLYTEREKLNNQFEASVASGIIKEGTEIWYDMQSQINEVNEAILDTIVNIKDMSNQLMNLNFEKFEYMQGKIENLTSEADFYLNLIESMDKALYDENSNITDEGITAAGLHAQNLNTYLQQADDYAKKIAEIEKEIANDPLNNDLTDKKQEYIEAQREAVLSAQDERNAIADLVKDGYDKQLDSLSDLISKYKDLMSVQKDAYDYEKQMSEKAETLASLKKQYEAWKGDTSEEGMKVRQELEVQIKDAQKDIQESEYDKLISDTEKLLDNLQEEYETLINERIDNIDSELQNITGSVNESASIIAGVLEELSNDTGLPLTNAMLNIWNDAQPVADINSSVENVNDTLSGTNEAIQGLRDDVQKILSQMEKEIEDTKAEIANGNANNTGNNGNSGNNSSDSTPLSPANGSNSSNGSSTSNNGSNSSKDNDWSIYKYYYPQKLNTDTSVVDRLKSNNIDASFEARSRYWDKLIGEGTYKSTYDQNVKLLNWLKNNGYANGTKSAAKGWHLFDENGLGSEVVLTKQGVLKQFEGGEYVFDAQATENLWKLAQINPDRLIPDLKLNTSLPEMTNRNAFGNVNYSCGDVSFVLPNVKNYEDIMKQAQNDKRFEKMVQEMTLGETFGHNSFKKLQY